jgi:hypothetical protein
MDLSLPGNMAFRTPSLKKPRPWKCSFYLVISSDAAVLFTIFTPTAVVSAADSSIRAVRAKR